MDKTYKEEISQVEDIPTLNNPIEYLEQSTIKKQTRLTQQHEQSITISQHKTPLLKVNDLTVLCEPSDNEKDDVIVGKQSITTIHTVGSIYQQHIADGDTTVSQNKSNINFVVAHLNLVVKKEGKQEKEIIQIPIKVDRDTSNNPLIYSMEYVYGKLSEDKDQIEQSNVSCRQQNAYNSPLLQTQQVVFTKTPSEIYNGLYAQKYRHSEQALYEYLNTENFINNLIELMKKEKVIKLQSVVLDLHSTNNMCNNCCHGTYGVLSTNNVNNYEFCTILENKIKEYNKQSKQLINIENKLKHRNTFYRMLRLVSDNYFIDGTVEDPLKTQPVINIQSPIYINTINQRIITNNNTEQIELNKYKESIKQFTIFASRGESAENYCKNILQRDRR